MPLYRLTIFFLVPHCAAIFFSGGGCGCGCPPPPNCSCQLPPPPSCTYAIPKPNIPCYQGTPRYPAPPPIPPPPPPNSYVASSSFQEKVPASHYSTEPIPIEKPSPARYDTEISLLSSNTDTSNPTNAYKSKADTEDYEILTGSGFRRKPQKIRRENNENKCVNDQLRRIIHKSILKSSSQLEAKVSISYAAKEAFGYNFDVICAEKPFSFNLNSGLYCELSVAGTFCLAFQH